MEISRYLAMTRAEMDAFSIPEHHIPAYMACHFSPYSAGLSNLPEQLAEGSMLIVNDRTPICGHDPNRIMRQLQEILERFRCGCLLLDLQRPEVPETAALCKMLVRNISCPLGISDLYAKEADCTVFLPPLPLRESLEAYIAPWQGREIWLDIAPETACVSVTKEGSTVTSLPDSLPPENAFTDAALHCYYRAEISEDRINFHLWRNQGSLIREAEQLGVTKCIGLYQELYVTK